MSGAAAHRALGLPSLMPAGVMQALYLLGFGAALFFVLSGDTLDAVLCFGPVPIAMGLSMTSQVDRKQYIARLLAATLFLPLLLLFWASSHPSGDWRLLLPVLLHVAAFLILILWLARACTRIEAAADSVPIGGDRFARRLESLQRNANGLYRVTREASGTDWTIDLLAEGQSGRRHRMTLRLEPDGKSVQVKEFMTAAGAATNTAQERDMRSTGEPAFDPTRPDAQTIWNRARQSSMVEPDRLARTRVEFDGDSVRFLLPSEAPIDDDAVIALFAAVATRSGYCWSPRLFG